jgi:predicted nucleic acid-binding protein
MLYDLDSNIVIDAVEGQPPFQQRARDHIAALENAGHRFVVSDLTWTECLVLTPRATDGALLRAVRLE